MGTKCKKYKPENLPDLLPVFPLSGVLLLPRGDLPLNIFEPRYLAMTDQALTNQDRMIGIIQPRTDEGLDLFDVGCAGRITSFAETDDGRYLITLTGITRFKIREELSQQAGFRRVVPDFSDFHHDLTGCGGLDLDRTRLLALLRDYFKAEGLSCQWDMVKSASDDTLITVLAMVCPFGEAEKQALLESINSASRANLFMTMLEMAVLEQRNRDDNDGLCH